jgi:hypothetical protein
MNSNIRIAATKCFLGTWFVSGIYIYLALRRYPYNNNNNNNNNR